MRPKILFVTRTSPFAGDSGSGAYVFSLLDYLSRKGFDIQVIWTTPPDLIPTRGWYSSPRMVRPVFRLEIMHMLRFSRHFWSPLVVWLPFKARLFHRVKTVMKTLYLWHPSPRSAAPAVAAPSANAWGSVASPAEETFIRDAIDRYRPTAVIANYSWLANAARVPGATVPAVVVLTHDVRHRQLKLHEGRTEEVQNGSPTPDEEAAQLAASDALIAIQSAEAAVFARLLPGKRIVTAPMAVAVQHLPHPGTPTALFVGSGHHANLTGLHWFLAEVWPRLRRELPGARLLVAGSICSHLNESLPDDVEKLGRLPDLTSAYLRAAVVIAPILQGSGIKAKLIEALGFCRPCVTTSVGVEGLEQFVPALRVADTPVAFAQETLAFMSDAGLVASTATRIEELARQHLSPPVCYDSVVALLREVSAASTLTAPPLRL